MRVHQSSLFYGAGYVHIELIWHRTRTPQTGSNLLQIMARQKTRTLSSVLFILRYLSSSQPLSLCVCRTYTSFRRPENLLPIFRLLAVFARRVPSEGDLKTKVPIRSRVNASVVYDGADRAYIDLPHTKLFVLELLRNAISSMFDRVSLIALFSVTGEGRIRNVLLLSSHYNYASL